MKNVTRNLSIVALLFAFTLATTTTFANNENPTTSTIELKFIGKHENQPIFELNLANKEADEFSIIIRDEFGSLLYAGKAKGTNVTRKFMLNEEVGDANLYVEVRSKKSSKSETYRISKSYSYKDEPVITSAK